MYSIYRKLVLPVHHMHECCHFAAGKLLGLKPEMRWCSVVLHGAEIGVANWRVWITTFVAVIPGFIWMTLAIAIGIHRRSNLLIMLGILFNLSWQAMSAGDWYDCWFMLKHRRYPNENERRFTTSRRLDHAKQSQ